jgi:dCMP deaminase
MDKRIVPNWNEYFMKMAEFVKTKSKDRSTQVGAIIVGDGNSVLSMGYNGFPRGVEDEKDSRHERPDKYLYTEHAERNAIYSAARNGVRLLGSTMYMPGGGAPCADCARALIQAGIKKFVGVDKPFVGKGTWSESCKAGEEMMREAGIEIIMLDENYVPTEFQGQCSRIAKKMIFTDLEKSLGEDAP